MQSRFSFSCTFNKQCKYSTVKQNGLDIAFGIFFFFFFHFRLRDFRVYNSKHLGYCPVLNINYITKWIAFHYTYSFPQTVFRLARSLLIENNLLKTFVLVKIRENICARRYSTVYTYTVLINALFLRSQTKGILWTSENIGPNSRINFIKWWFLNIALLRCHLLLRFDAVFFRPFPRSYHSPTFNKRRMNSSYKRNAHMNWNKFSH